MKNRSKALAYSGLCITIFFWAINTTLARGVAFQIRPMALSFFRWAVALIIIIPFAIPFLKRDISQIRQNLLFLILLSIPSVAVYNSVVYLGAQYTTATNIALVVATMPVMTILLAWMITHDKPSVRQSVGVIISFCGVLAIITQGSWQALAGVNFNPGDILIVFSVFSWSLYSVLLRTRQIDISPISLLTVLIFFGMLFILPFYLWEYSVYKGFEVDSQTIAIFLFLGICPSIISYICWVYGVKTAGAPVASVFMYLLPVFTSILAGIFLNEALAAYHYIGGAMILAGLILSSLK